MLLTVIIITVVLALLVTCTTTSFFYAVSKRNATTANEYAAHLRKIAPVLAKSVLRNESLQSKLDSMLLQDR